MVSSSGGQLEIMFGTSHTYYYLPGQSRVTVLALFLSSPEDGNRSSFRNVAFSSYLEFRTMGRDQKPSDSEQQRSSVTKFDKYGHVLVPPQFSVKDETSLTEDFGVIPCIAS
jgi:hypothetical protein